MRTFLRQSPHLSALSARFLASLVEVQVLSEAAQLALQLTPLTSSIQGLQYRGVGGYAAIRAPVPPASRRRC